MQTLRCYERISIENRRFRSNGVSLTQNFNRRGRPDQPFFFSENYRLNDVSYGTKIWADLSSVLLQSTRLTDGQTDRQTDGETPFSSLGLSIDNDLDDLE